MPNKSMMAKNTIYWIFLNLFNIREINSKDLLIKIKALNLN